MRSKVILFLSLIMGVVTTVLFFNYMKQFDTEVVLSENMVDVIVANSDIKENETISPDMVKVMAVPEKGLHASTVTSVDEVAGKFATADISAGETLLTHRVKSEKEEQLFVSRKIKDGFRGISVGLNFVQSISNLIEPEDRVDVIFSEATTEDNGDVKVDSEIILSEVTVLAVGRKMIASTSEEEEYVEYSSVTLELTPQDTVKLANASERGTIQLALHSRVIETEEKSEDK
ncbi:pilus assembly protein CpaB [Salirhabdus euzebyi]|uniref:Pilus assembly protein CpaB n=1 Tax=Salirhabdus euzebyi TaxID=394506 RepID=A0A841Q9M4_9BACI|nr:Flp pilus assembly protein CpaB [Salirhabdus euzebyi]MBB6455110.1 pilus assembly protein CpaB [Salirhabdus euzebyi]